MTNSDKRKKCRKSSTDNSEQADLDSYLSGSRASGRNQDLNRTLADVKHELQTMLETMGPGTPQLQNTSSEAENDTSVCTVSTSSNPEDTKKKVSDSDGPAESQDTSTAQEETSTSLSSQTKNTSVLVEFPSSQSHRIDDIDDMLRTDDNAAPNANTSYIGYPQPVSHYATPPHTIQQSPYNREQFIQPTVRSCRIHSSPYYHSGNDFMKKKKGILEWFGYKPQRSSNSELYKVRIKQESPNVLPKQLTFERADEVPGLSPLRIKKLPECQRHQFRNERFPSLRPQTFQTPPSPKCWKSLDKRYTSRENYHPETCNQQRGDCFYHPNTMPTYSDMSCPCEENTEPYSPTHSLIVQNHSSMPNYSPRSFHRKPFDYDSHPPTQTALSFPESYPEKLINVTDNFGQNYCFPPPSKEECHIKVPEKSDRGGKQKEDSKQTSSPLKSSPVPEKECAKCGNANSSSFNTVPNSRVFGHESSSFVRSPENNYEMMHYGDTSFDHQRIAYYDTSGATRVDVYYFDHGNAGYYRTTDLSPPVASEAIAEKTEAYTSKFWAEIFGTVHIGFSFFTSFVLQFIRFIMYGLLRPLLVGGMQLVSDYFLKPTLSTCFNSVIQPFLIFIYNIASSVRDLCDPIAAGIGYYIREIAVFIRAFRIVDVHQIKKDGPSPCVNCNRPAIVGDVRRKSNR